MIDRDQRSYWCQERSRRGLVPGRPEFGRTGFMSRLDQACVLVTTLPSDPLRCALDLDDDALFDSVLPRAFTGKVSDAVSMLVHLASTADALVRYATTGGSGDKWRAFASIRQDGGVDVGAGAVARFEYRPGSTLAGLASYRLFVLVHLVRVAVATQARLCASFGSDDLAPFELIVAIPAAAGALLGGFADGWEQPEHSFDVPLCVEQDPLVRTEVERWPIGPVDQERLLVKVASGICNAFNLREDRFLARTGEAGGQIASTYA